MMRCSLVGRRHHQPRVALTPDDEIRLAREPDNQFDANAIRVCALFGEEWLTVGYVDRASAALLTDKALRGARIIAQGDAYVVPIEVEV